MARPIPTGVDPDTFTQFEHHVREMLRMLGRSDEPGTDETPFRVAKFWLTELHPGRDFDPAEALSTVFEEPYNEMVSKLNIPVVSFCEHHMLPFVGVAHIAYVPNGKIVGISKFTRLVDLAAHRLSLQERLTNQIADSIEKVLEPLGVAVVLRCTHTCEAVRGVRTANQTMVTSAMRGVFLNPEKRAREEFLALVDGNGYHR